MLGKHSGKHAVQARLRAPGLRASAEELEDLTARVKELADRKKFVYDDDLLALVSHAPERRVRLVRYQVVSGNQLLPTATVEVEVDGARRSASAVGNGPLDAALKAADIALGGERRAARDAHARGDRGQGRAGRGDRARARRRHESTGQAASTDSIEAALKAYLSAVGARRAARWRRRHDASPARCSRRSGTRTSCVPRPRTRRPCSTSTCTSCTR